MITSELYLTSKYVQKDEWLKLIETISKYNGLLKKWKIIITNENNLIRYFIVTKCTLPSTINNLNSFLFKDTNEANIPNSKYGFLYKMNNLDNFIDLINAFETKHKDIPKYMEISFIKISKEKINSKITLYLEKNGVLKRHKIIGSNPTNILSINFLENKRYFFKNCPTYLDIKKTLHLLTSDRNNSLLEVDTFPYLQNKFYLNQFNFSFDKHSIIFGSTGSGKSKLISLLISNIYNNLNLKQKYKIVVIDPHASLEDEIGTLGKVVDFLSKEDSINLFTNNDNEIISTTEIILDLLKTLMTQEYNSKLERVLRHSIYLLLVDKSFNFNNLKKLVLDLEYRNNLIKRWKYSLPISVIDFFLSDFNDFKVKYYGESISPIISFVDEIELLPAFNEDYDISLEDSIKNNFLTLFSLDRTKLGDKITKTISGLIMQQLLSLIQRKKFDEHIIFIIDEVSIIENPILSKYLSEARKYNLSLILAGQYFNQISNELRSSIFANVTNYFIFRVSRSDANMLVDNLCMNLPIDDSLDKRVKMLTELNNRECIVRIENNDILLPAFKAKTLDYKGNKRINNKVNINKSKQINESNSSFLINNNINLKDVLNLL